MMGFGLIGTILVVVLAAYLLGWRPQEGQTLFRSSDKQQLPIDVLKARYARGEISKPEYEQIRDDFTRN